MSLSDVTAASCKQVVRSHRNQAVNQPFISKHSSAGWGGSSKQVLIPFSALLSLSHSYLSLGMKRSPVARSGDAMQVSRLYPHRVRFVFTARTDRLSDALAVQQSSVFIPDIKRNPFSHSMLYINLRKGDLCFTEKI